MGVKEGDIVTVCSVTTPEIIYAFYGLNRIGAISNMVDPRTSTEGIKHYIEEVQSKLVVTIDVALPKIEKSVIGTKVEKIITVSPLNSIPQPKKAIATFASKLKDGKVKLSANCIDWNDFYKTTSEPNYAEYKKDTCCVIVHTGGTTGTPKGVMLSNDNINAAALQCNICGTNFKRNDNWLNIMPPFIVYGIGNGLHLPLSIGMEVILIPKFEPEKFDDLLIKHTPNHISGVPSHYGNVINSKKLGNKSLEYLISPIVGGDCMIATLEEATNSFLTKHQCTQSVMKGYGMSEVCAAVSLTSGINRNSVGSVGIPFTHTTISVFDVDTGEELKYGEQGEVCMHGPNTMLGYYKNESETNAILKVHNDGKVWVHSGDLGYMTENGELFIIDRIKRMIVRHDGFKVFPTQIENAIIKNEAVASCCVVGSKDTEHSQGKLPIAFVTLKENTMQQEAKSELFDFCKSELPEYAQPVDFIFIDKLPLTPIGKVDYRKLEQMASEK